jgi:AraC-like DNA-binding protein
VDHGANNLLSASLAAGFGSYSQCHRAFRRELGCSPRDFFDSGLRTMMRDMIAPMQPPLD